MACIPTREGWLGIVLRSLYRSGHSGVGPVCTDHETGLFSHCWTALHSATNTCDTLSVPDEVLDRELFSQFSTGFLSGIHKNLIEDDTTRCIPFDYTIYRWRSPAQEERRAV
jgi:hypothetical protein